MGVTYRVVGFRTGVQSFIRARLGFLGECLDCYVPTPLNMSADWLGHCWLPPGAMCFCLDHQFVFLDLGLLEGSFFFLVFWGAFGWSHFGMFSSRGDHKFPFLLSFLSFFCSFLWACWASGGVLRYSGISESSHTTTNRYKHELYCMCVLSCTYFTFHNVICLIIQVLSLHGSIISNMHTSCYVFHYYHVLTF